MSKIDLGEIERELGEISKWPWKWKILKSRFGHERRAVSAKGKKLDAQGPDGDFAVKSPERIRALLDLAVEERAKNRCFMAWVTAGKSPRSFPSYWKNAGTSDRYVWLEQARAELYGEEKER